jgi:hypothetical protein
MERTLLVGAILAPWIPMVMLAIWLTRKALKAFRARRAIRRVLDA